MRSCWSCAEYCVENLEMSCTEYCVEKLGDELYRILRRELRDHVEVVQRTWWDECVEYCVEYCVEKLRDECVEYCAENLEMSV